MQPCCSNHDFVFFFTDFNVPNEDLNGWNVLLVFVSRCMMDSQVLWLVVGNCRFFKNLWSYPIYDPIDGERSRILPKWRKLAGTHKLPIRFRNNFFSTTYLTWAFSCNFDVLSSKSKLTKSQASFFWLIVAPKMVFFG